MTTLSNKDETGAQFTALGTLWRNTAKSYLAVFSVPALLPIGQHLSRELNSFFFSSLQLDGFRFFQLFVK